MNETTGGISEKFSEKPRRGRPRAFSAEIERLWKSSGLFDEAKSERGRLNVCYRQDAISVLVDVPGITWLFDEEAIMQGKKKMRRTILAELGRIRDDDELRAVALRICELKPTTREAVTIIRRYRLGRSVVGSAEGLSDVLCTAIDDYLSAHPDLTGREVLEALDDAYSAVQTVYAAKKEAA